MLCGGKARPALCRNFNYIRVRSFVPNGVAFGLNDLAAISAMGLQTQLSNYVTAANLLGAGCGGDFIWFLWRLFCMPDLF